MTRTSSIASESGRLLARNRGRMPAGASRMTPSLPVTRPESSSQMVCDISPAHDTLSMRHSTHSPFQRAPAIRTGSPREPGAASSATNVRRTRPSTNTASDSAAAGCAGSTNVQGAAPRAT